MHVVPCSLRRMLRASTCPGELDAELVDAALVAPDLPVGCFELWAAPTTPTSVVSASTTPLTSPSTSPDQPPCVPGGGISGWGWGADVLWRPVPAGRGERGAGGSQRGAASLEEPGTWAALERRSSEPLFWGSLQHPRKYERLQCMLRHEAEAAGPATRQLFDARAEAATAHAQVTCLKEALLKVGRGGHWVLHALICVLFSV